MNDTHKEKKLKIGDVVMPIEEEFQKTFQFGNTAKKMLKAISNTDCKIIDVKNYQCGCQKKNGDQHTCILKSMDCNQRIWLLIDGHKTSFSAKFFCLKNLS